MLRSIASSTALLSVSAAQAVEVGDVIWLSSNGVIDTDGRLLMLDLTPRGHLRQGRSTDGPGRDPKTLTLDQAPVRRQRL